MREAENMPRPLCHRQGSGDSLFFTCNVQVSCLCSQRLDPLLVQVNEEVDGQGKGCAFCDDERVPKGVETEEAPEQIGCRKQKNQLSGYRDDHGDIAFPDALEQCHEDNAKTCGDEAEADALHGYDSNGKHLIGSIEPPKQHMRQEGEDQETRGHDAQGNHHSHPDGLGDALGPFRPIVVAYDRDHTAVQTENRHEDEGLQAEIDAEYRDGTGSEADEDLVEAGGKDGTDRLHDDGRKPYRIDVFHRLFSQAEGGLGQPNLMILAHIEDCKQG